MSLFEEKFCGITWGHPGRTGTWDSPSAMESIKAVNELEPNWIVVAFEGQQETAHSAEITFGRGSMLSDSEVRFAIRTFRAEGKKVCLKPMVNPQDGNWRGFISFFAVDVPGEPNWNEWFASYKTFITHYASIAEDEGCELFSIGCEMVMTDHQSDRWRDVVAAVRNVYSGLITYNCDKYQEANVDWWDSVDVISTSAYYPEGTWDANLARIKEVVDRHKKPFLFLESGCPSRTGSALRPNDWKLTGQQNLSEQDRYFEGLLLAALHTDWIWGLAIWDQQSEIPNEYHPENDSGYGILGKPAGARLRTEFLRCKAENRKPI